MTPRTRNTSRTGAKQPQDQSRADIIPPQSPDTAAHGAYIRDMVFELRSIAEKHNMIVLAYFLDMAHEEASNQARPEPE